MLRYSHRFATIAIVHYICYIYYVVNNGDIVNNKPNLVANAARVFREIFAGIEETRVDAKYAPHTSLRLAAAMREPRYDLILEVQFGKAKIRLAVEARTRITPQTALMNWPRRPSSSTGPIPVVYAPVISARIAEILRQQQIGYADGVGNCWLVSAPQRLLIERTGFQADRRKTPAAVDLFSPKSSRIVRALLSRPLEGWQVRQLAEHPDVEVSAGLVVKVKRGLLAEGYAVEHERRLYLRDPVGLLNAWSRGYSGPAERTALYFRGETYEAERAVAGWCARQGLRHALAGFSAGWRLAPKVRYHVASVYLEDRGFDPPLVNEMLSQLGGKRVDTGPNLFLWRPYDRSVFAGSGPVGGEPSPATSVVQTFLDLKREAGRGEDASRKSSV